MLCPNCETVNRDGAKFCDECGFPLTGAIAARAAEVVAANSEEAGNAAAREEVLVEGATEAIDIVEETAAEAAEALEEATEAAVEAVEEAEEAVEEAAEEAIEGATELIEVTEVQAEEAKDQLSPDITMVLGDELAGLDVIDDEYGERLVGSDYQAPEANWRDGHTMQMPRIEGDEAPRSKDFLASSTVKKDNDKKIKIGVIVAVVVIAAIIALATYSMELWGGKAVPDVRGMTEADATSVLEESGFTVRSMQVKSDDTEGLVLVMDPNAGARANEGDEIVIHIATAREIPDVIGKTEEEAKAKFEEDGYENVTYEKEHSDSTEGTVLSISPEPGTRAKSSLPVIVKIAEPYVVPDTSTLDMYGAIEAIQKEGLNYDIAYYDTTDYVEGTVLGTDPAAGTKVQSSTVVVITVARARGVQLTAAAKDALAPGTEVSIGGTSYIISSLDSVEYIGDDQVSFTATGRPFTYFFGAYVEGEPQQISGVISFTADNQVSSIS